jgi:hypothetical protein
VTDDDRRFIRNELDSIDHRCPLSWLLSEEPIVSEAQTSQTVTLDEFKVTNMIASEPSCIFVEKATVLKRTSNNIQMIENATKGQTSCTAGTCYDSTA